MFPKTMLPDGSFAVNLPRGIAFSSRANFGQILVGKFGF
jgi:hypothetical protein